MIACLILLCSLIVVGVILRLTHKPDASPEPIQEEKTEECCGLHEICEKINTSRLEKPEYYDDEELDDLAGIAADSYSAEQIEEFRDIMLTLLPSDVAGWKVSLERRGISLPEELQDEFLLLITETTNS